MHGPFPSWSTYAAGAFVGAADPALPSQPCAAADSRVPSHRVLGDAWIPSVPGRGGAHGFLSLLEDRSVTPEMFEDVAAADDYLTASGAASAAGPAAAACYGLASVDGRYTDASGSYLVKPQIASLTPTCVELSGAPMAALLQEMTTPGSVEKQSCLGYSDRVAERLMEPYAARSLSAVSGSFSHYRSAEDIVSSNRQGQNITPEMASGGSGNGTSRRKPEERAGGSTKKSKKEASKTSPPKPQASNVKLGEKITALQQIVSPFGKTDRASVLLETIKYVKFLHEQIQLFSEPYMTKSTHKGRIQFGVEEEEAGTQQGLRGSGLCLAPVSWTSQVYRDDTLPDCWTPAYRSCLYQ